MIKRKMVPEFASDPNRLIKTGIFVRAKKSTKFPAIAQRNQR
jgi:hypothetical protein